MAPLWIKDALVRAKEQSESLNRILKETAHELAEVAKEVTSELLPLELATDNSLNVSETQLEKIAQSMETRAFPRVLQTLLLWVERLSSAGSEINSWAGGVRQSSMDNGDEGLVRFRNTFLKSRALEFAILSILRSPRLRQQFLKEGDNVPTELLHALLSLALVGGDAVVVPLLEKIVLVPCTAGFSMDQQRAVATLLSSLKVPPAEEPAETSHGERSLSPERPAASPRGGSSKHETSQSLQATLTATKLRLSAAESTDSGVILARQIPYICRQASLSHSATGSARRSTLNANRSALGLLGRSCEDHLAAHHPLSEEELTQAANLHIDQMEAEAAALQAAYLEQRTHLSANKAAICERVAVVESNRAKHASALDLAQAELVKVQVEREAVESAMTQAGLSLRSTVAHLAGFVQQSQEERAKLEAALQVVDMLKSLALDALKESSSEEEAETANLAVRRSEVEVLLRKACGEHLIAADEIIRSDPAEAEQTRASLDRFRARFEPFLTAN